LYNPSEISIGNHVRIDDFCVLSAGKGGIEIHDYIHIGVYSSLIGSGRITLKSFANISSKVAIYSSNDDYSGEFLTNPMVPSEFTNVTHLDVSIANHVIIGCGSVIMPGVTIGIGAAVGAMSFIKSDIPEFHMVAGNPSKFIKNRKRDLLEFENRIRQDIKSL
jgi:galactoside O-acetyltransferase